MTYALFSKGVSLEPLVKTILGWSGYYNSVAGYTEAIMTYPRMELSWSLYKSGSNNVSQLRVTETLISNGSPRGGYKALDPPSKILSKQD